MATDAELRIALDHASAVLGERARRDVPIGPLTTYRVGGRAALLLDAEGVDDLRAAAGAVRGTALPVLVVGKGSNLLVADRGFRGLVITLGAFATTTSTGSGVPRTAPAAALRSSTPSASTSRAASPPTR